ncbi:MAG TPA: hypothetical protein VLE99_05735 [Candidatus Saccharimonadales bacterium]|nr:hypothetical protein [Candidatus Saccharimonadales bacterium]
MARPGLEEQVEQTQVTQQKVAKVLATPSGDDATRQKVAKMFVHYYFWILILIIAGVPLYNYLMFKHAGSPGLIVSLKDAILTYSAVAGPTFGLVVAYYFKSKND